MKVVFSRLSVQCAAMVGHYSAFAIAVAVCLLWALSGPLFGFSDTWQLFINTGTTVLTFLMVFLIQNAQNRDARAIQLKLNELVQAVDSANNRLVNVEEATDEELNDLTNTYRSSEKEELT